MCKNKYLVVICFLLFTIFSSCKQESKEYQNIILADGWKIHQADSTIANGTVVASTQLDVSRWYPTSIPSTVMATLVENGLYDDLFVGTNLKDIDKTLFDKPWWYRTEFEIPELNDNQHIFINFDGINYYANIWFNGILIANKDTVYGTYRRFSFDITEYAEEKNVLAVEVSRALPGDPSVGFADWNPRPADENMGLFRGVSLSIVGGVKLNNSYVKAKLNKNTWQEAWLTLETEVENLSDKPVVGKLEGVLEAQSFSYPISLAPREKKFVKLTSQDISALHVNNPRLWWCNNMGNPELYELKLNFKTENRISTEETINFGIRDIETFFTNKGHRGFKLNGKKVLVKSAGWTDDIFLRETAKANEEQVLLVKDMNLNMIRFENFWGASSNIYDLCDKHGLLVLIGWSCQWEWEAYYGEPCNETYGCILSDEDIDIVADYFEQQVLWLRNHPSIAAWMPGSDMLPIPKLEEKYLAFLKENDDRPYIGAAKERTSELSGPTGTKMAGPYEYVGPNYWYIDSIYGGAFGFNTETGIGAQLPVKESIKKFIPEDKLWPINDAWSYHCTGSTTAMNSLNIMTEVISNKYGQARDLDDYLLKADLVGYEGTRAMFEAFRVNLSESTGIVQWMLNSAWPSFYWQLYDYYKVPTSSYYAVKKANMPIQLIYNYGNNSIYVVNETPNDVQDYRAIVRVYDVKSKQIDKQEMKVNIFTDTSTQILKLNPLTENVFVSLELFDEVGNSVSDNFYCVSNIHDKYLWNETTWVHTPAKSYSDFKNIANMPRVDLKVTAERIRSQEEYIYQVKVVNLSNHIGFFTNLKLKNEKDEMITPAFWSDNYISLLPGQQKVLECKVEKIIADNEKLNIEVKGWNSSVIKISL